VSYQVNEVFYSLQGEGMRAGTANVFVRFAGCNLRCRIEPGEDSPGGFDCDTEFASGRKLGLDDLLAWMDVEQKTAPAPLDGERWCVLTGGEPGLQLDRELIDALHTDRWRIAIETNGSIELPSGIDWVCVSPKVAEHAIRQLKADEVKYVRGFGQAIPRPRVVAEHKLISPVFAGSEIDPKALAWCVGLIKENPEWRLSIQMHKAWRVR
jgi:organic radical activating enzyme